MLRDVSEKKVKGRTKNIQSKKIKEWLNTLGRVILKKVGDKDIHFNIDFKGKFSRVAAFTPTYS